MAKRKKTKKRKRGVNILDVDDGFQDPGANIGVRRADKHQYEGSSDQYEGGSRRPAYYDRRRKVEPDNEILVKQPSCYLKEFDSDEVAIEATSSPGYYKRWRRQQYERRTDHDRDACQLTEDDVK